jgi:hypothetical protein
MQIGGLNISVGFLVDNLTPTAILQQTLPKVLYRRHKE